MINMFWETYMTTYNNEHVKLHFDNDRDICVSSKNYEANGYMQDLSLLVISH